MNKNVVITPSVAEDVYTLKDILRAEDIQECKACGNTPMQALMAGFIWSECYTAKIKDKAEAMFGVSEAKTDMEGRPHPTKKMGIIWFLGSDEVFKYPISLVKGGRQYVDRWLEKYDILYNAVDARNERHIAWLKHIGFIFSKPVTINGYKFCTFYKTRERN